MKETDMYEPVKYLLESQGFLVKGEVKDCDVAAVKDDVLWVVEMKLGFNLKLVYQLIARQAATDWVYAAIPRPKSERDVNYKNAVRLLKKINCGLITVSLGGAMPPHAEIILFPNGKTNKSNKKTVSIKNEINGRTGDSAGGSAKTAINTAYRERCVRIACILEAKGAQKGSDLINRYGCERDANSILKSNFHDWYRKIGRGIYELSPKGSAYLSENSGNSVIAYYKMKANDFKTEL